MASYIMSFRESLEAFLLIAIILQYIRASGLNKLKPAVLWGAFSGLVASGTIGLLLLKISSSSDQTAIIAKYWESGSSFIALLLVSMFIIWMINHGANIKEHIEGSLSKSLTRTGVFLISAIVVAREGTEIALFSYAGKYSFDVILYGAISALILTIAIFRSMVKIDIGLLFKITLVYLILQAGFLWGYSVHELLSALKAGGELVVGHPVFIKAFDLSQGIFNHKNGIIGMPLHLIIGWYSKPEIVQFIAQYIFTLGMLAYWKKKQT